MAPIATDLQGLNNLSSFAELLDLISSASITSW